MAARIKKEIPVILADAVSPRGGRKQIPFAFMLGAGGICQPFDMIQKFPLFDKPLKIFDSLTP